jgi:excisionase family DNA binding protein
MENFVKIDRICELLGVTKPTIYTWIRNKGLPCVKTGSSKSAIRFKKSEVVSWFEKLPDKE